MDLNELEKIRVEKINAMRVAGVEPYPTRSEVNISVKQAVEAFDQFESSHPDEPLSGDFILGGRIRSIRTMGKLAFAHIEDGSGRIQLMLRVNELGQENLDQFKNWFDLGDFIQATGSLMRSRSGEVTLLVSAFKMLSKAVSPLPAAKDEEVDGQIIRHATLNDPETRFRERYADLAINQDVREIFRTRTAVVRSLQRFMDSHGFLEVETPILQPIYGGAAAQPFTTYHNQLKQELFLRISFELYLKRLLVGGLDRRIR